jgi:hypothetical protein
MALPIFKCGKSRVAARLRCNNDTSTPPPKDGDSWDILDEGAHGIIIDTLDDNTALQVADLTTSKAVYDIIIKIYEGTNTNSTMFYTWVEMMDLKWDGTSSISDHIANVRARERRLAALGRPIDSVFLAYFLLHSLPLDSTWSSFTASVLIQTAQTASDIWRQVHCGSNRIWRCSCAQQHQREHNGDHPV